MVGPMEFKMLHLSLIKWRRFVGQQGGSSHHRTFPGGGGDGDCAGTVLEGVGGMRGRIARLWGSETRRASLTREARIIAIGIAIGLIAHVIYLFVLSTLPVESSGQAILGERFTTYW